MTQFEYLTTFTAFLYAIMVGRAVITLAGMTSGSRYSRHILWLVVLIINLFQAWWLRWSGHDDQLTYGSYLLSIAHTIPLIFAVAILSPAKEPGDWKSYLESTRVWFFISYALFWVAIGVSNFFLGSNASGAIGPFFLCVLGAATAQRHVQWGIPLFFLLVFILIGISLTLQQ